MEIIYIKSVEEFISKIGVGSDTEYLYRGVSNENYELIPTLFRIDSKMRAIIGDKWKIIENKILGDFKKQIYPYTKGSINGDIDLLTLGQHHGLPTRLLDWSSKPLVAMFFSVESLSKESGAIYQVQPLRTMNVDRLNDRTTLEKYDITFISPNHVSSRTKAQGSWFSQHKIPEGNRDHIPDFSGFSIKKYIIESKNKIKIKKELDSLGVNYSTIYDDIEGISKNILWGLEKQNLKDTTPPHS